MALVECSNNIIANVSGSYRVMQDFLYPGYCVGNCARHGYSQRLRSQSSDAIVRQAGGAVGSGRGGQPLL